MNARPFNTGIHAAGSGYYPQFKATGGLIVEAQPVPKTPFVDTPYKTNTGHLISRKKNFIYDNAIVHNSRRKPEDPYPSTKAEFKGNLGGKTDYASRVMEYKETTNATYNRMLVNKQAAQEAIPHQWLRPAQVNFHGRKKTVLDYKKLASDKHLQAKVDKLKTLGYSDAEIGKAISADREADITKILHEDILASVDKAQREYTWSQGVNEAWAESVAELREGSPSVVRGSTAVGATSPSRTEQLLAAATATTVPVRGRRTAASSSAQSAPALATAPPSPPSPSSAASPVVKVKKSKK